MAEPGDKLNKSSDNKLRKIQKEKQFFEENFSCYLSDDDITLAQKFTRRNLFDKAS